MKIINLCKHLLYKDSFVRCFTVLCNRQKKLRIYQMYLGNVPLWFVREMRRMRAAKLKRSSITKAQETLLKSTERGPQNDSRVSQITWKSWPLGFLILAFELLMTFISREHEFLLLFFFLCSNFIFENTALYIFSFLTLKLWFLFYLTDVQWLWNINANTNINNELNNEGFGLKYLTLTWVQT